MEWRFLKTLLQDLIQELVSLNEALGLQGWLIVLTLVLSGMSYRSQKRAGIREAIEQLDPRHGDYSLLYPSGSDFPRDVQVKSGLNSIHLIRRKSRISFICNKIDSQSDRVVQHSVPPYYLTLPEKATNQINPLRDRILSHDQIEDVERDNSQIVITASTTNPVECRQVSNYVLDEIDSTADNPITVDQFKPWRDSQ